MSNKSKSYKKSAPRVYIQTFGCQMNKYDSEVMRSLLLKRGYQFTDNWKEADVILVNTCSVRQHAEDRVYSYLGKWGKYKEEKRPELIIGVCGCMAQKEGMNLVERMPCIDLVCGTHSIPLIHELISDLEKGGGRRIELSEDFDNFPPPVYEAKESKISAWVVIMRGCENYCSYCVVPYVRGKEVSRPPEDIADEVRRLADEGVKEVTLLGQNVNSYKINQYSTLSTEGDFSSLLERINRIEGIERIRFATSHPKDMSTETIEAIRSLPKVCEHIHLPVQSGSDKILRLMNRKYTRNQYRELVSTIREAIPEVSVTTDIIVGFPQETEEDFMDTYELLKEIQFDASFIFKYSPRAGTKAYEMEDDVPEEVKRERLNTLLSLQKRISQRINEKLTGTQVEILVDGYESRPSVSFVAGREAKSQSKLFGKTLTFKSVSFGGDEKVIGKLVNVKITQVRYGLLEGVIV